MHGLVLDRLNTFQRNSIVLDGEGQSNVLLVHLRYFSALDINKG